MLSATTCIQRVCFSSKKVLAVIVVFCVLLSLIANYQNKVKSKTSWIFSFGNSSSLSEFSQKLYLYGANENKSHGNTPRIDVHIEDPVFGHTGEVQDVDVEDEERENTTKIAIGGGITSRMAKGVTLDNLEKSLQVFTTLLPSFCATVSLGYDYQFYFGYDYNDPMFSNPNFTRAFAETFRRILDRACPKALKADLHVVQCSHLGKPTWAQNDAMLEAYIDNVDYFYRVNDDTKLQTKGWAEEFIKTLKSYDPPNVGTVGPNHSGGNTAILTYDFVHRTHVDIFGFYYPKLFTDWWGDDWITFVYRPGRSTKLNHIRLAHTMTLGQRYHTDYSVGNKLPARLAIDQATLKRYLMRTNYSSSAVHESGKMVISMALYGKDPAHTWGAIRNAQLAPIVFPGWTLRLHIPHPRHFPQNVTVPARITRKLKQLGAEIVHMHESDIPPIYWSYTVATDATVKYFLVRDVDSRITDRDAAAVNEWLDKFNDTAFHCIRDNPRHARTPIVDGLWGGNGKKLTEILHGKSLVELVQEFLTNISRTKSEFNSRLSNVSLEHNSSFLEQILWPRVAEAVLCHDSVSCDRWNASVSFPVKRSSREYLGQKFDRRQEPIDIFMPLSSNESYPECNAYEYLHSRTNKTKS